MTQVTSGLGATAVVTAVVVLALLLEAAPAEARPEDEARQRIETVVDGLGLDPVRIKSVQVISNREGGEAPSSSYSGWVSFTDCTGNLVISLDRLAKVRRLYTTGVCVVPGVD